MDLRRWLALGRLTPEATFAKHRECRESFAAPPANINGTSPQSRKPFTLKNRAQWSPSQRIEPEAQGALECLLPTLD